MPRTRLLLCIAGVSCCVATVPAGELKFTWQLPYCNGGHGGAFSLQPGESMVVYDSEDCGPNVGPLNCSLSSDGLYLSGHGFYQDSYTSKFYWNGEPILQSDPPEPYTGPCSRREQDDAACCWPQSSQPKAP